MALTFELTACLQIMVSQKVAAGVYKGVTTSELDELAAETAASLTSTHPDYATVGVWLAHTSFLHTPAIPCLRTLSVYPCTLHCSWLPALQFQTCTRARSSLSWRGGLVVSMR